MWVYNYDNDETIVGRPCDKLLYDTLFWVITVTWILGGIQLFLALALYCYIRQKMSSF